MPAPGWDSATLFEDSGRATRPDIDNRPLSTYLFAFEELENNLHPALLRRLLMHLRQVAVTSGCIVVLTTHSSTVIDMFSGDDRAQLLHVTHDGTSSHVGAVEDYGRAAGVLDDLDVRASDLLQSNGVIWVEGPSDRIYLNHWISLWSQGQLR